MENSNEDTINLLLKKLDEKVNTYNTSDFSDELNNFRNWIDSKGDDEKKEILEFTMPKIKALLEKIKNKQKVFEEMLVENTEYRRTNQKYSKY